MPTTNLMFEGVSVDDIFQKVTKSGVDVSTAGVIAASWVLDNLRKTRRVFAYKEAFPEQDANCTVPPWERSFVHADWADGEDVVQAGQTVGEEGFNSRFHKIEADLDHLGADVGKVFACLAEMRASVRHLLDEIRVEINLINADINDCCNKGGRLDPFTGVSPGYLDTGVFKGTSYVLGKKVNLWETKTGMLMLPVVDPVDATTVFGGDIAGVGDLTKFVHDDPRVKDSFPGELKLRDFVGKFGDEVLPSGRKVKDVVKVLPPEATYADTNKMVEEFSDLQAAVVRSREGADAAVTAAMGVESTTALADASIEKMNEVPASVRTALAAEGVTSIGALANMAPDRMREIAAAAGVRATAGDVAGWTVGARTLVRIGR